mmetsp:Transcript_108851/g.304745  ORF Transcript_108851/g.304745 Transcript_108851/m.304745 type:complete len:377 (-) Transcript_108851:161-1291(-)
MCGRRASYGEDLGAEVSRGSRQLHCGGRDPLRDHLPVPCRRRCSHRRQSSLRRNPILGLCGRIRVLRLLRRRPSLRPYLGALPLLRLLRLADLHARLERGVAGPLPQAPGVRPRHGRLRRRVARRPPQGHVADHGRLPHRGPGGGLAHAGARVDAVAHPGGAERRVLVLYVHAVAHEGRALERPVGLRRAEAHEFGRLLRLGVQQPLEDLVEAMVHLIEGQVVTIIAERQLDFHGDVMDGPEGEDDEECVASTLRCTHPNGAEQGDGQEAGEDEHHPDRLREDEREGHGRYLVRIDEVHDTDGELLEDPRQNGGRNVDDPGAGVLHHEPLHPLEDDVLLRGCRLEVGQAAGLQAVHIQVGEAVPARARDVAHGVAD